MSEKTLRRWLVPGAALGTILVPLVVGGCFDESDAPFWYGIPGCEACSDCYDDWVGAPPAGMPEEFEFGGDPPLEHAVGIPEGSAGEQDSDPTDLGDETAGGTPRSRPTGIPDGVLRPHIDRPSTLPAHRETPNGGGYPSNSPGNPSPSGKSPR